jgi:hypothetical protein
MIMKTRALTIARTVVGVCVVAGLIYFLYGKNSPPAVGWLITLVVVVFVILSRRSGVYDKNPYFRRLAVGSSRKPLRDLGMAIICFVAMMAVTIAISIGVRDKVLPDNYVTVGFLLVVIVGGIIGVLFFISGVIVRVLHGPPPP